MDNLKKIEKLELLQEEQSNIETQNLFYDFDKAIEEKMQEPLDIKFNGKIWKVPSEMPFDFSMFFFRNCIIKVNGVDTFDVAENQIVNFLTLMFGIEFMKTLETTKVPTTLIFETLALQILNKWGYGVNVKAKGKGKVQKKI